MEVAHIAWVPAVCRALFEVLTILEGMIKGGQFSGEVSLSL